MLFNLRKNLIINETQLKGIIEEELGISNEVANKTDEIFGVLSKEIKNDKNIIEKEDGYSIIKGGFNFRFLNYKITTSYRAFNYYTKEGYDFSNFNSEGDSVYCGRDLFVMHLCVPSVSGNLIKSQTKEIIQHELEHIYQQAVIGKQFKGSFNYAKITNAQYSKDEREREIAQLLYMCIKPEQDAYVNSLYAFLMSEKDYCDEDTIKKSDCWRMYIDIKEIYNKYKDTDYFKKILKNYKLNQEKVEKQIDIFLRKIGHVIAKVRKDKIEKQNYRF